MRILIHGVNFSPELTGIGKYSGEMAAWLAQRGHEVRVVTAPPYYPEWRVGEGYSGLTYRTEKWPGVLVYRCPLWVPARPGGLTRLIHLMSFAVASLPVMLRQIFWRPDVVWVVAPALFCAPAAWTVARLSGAKAWLHIQDFELDAAFELGLLRGKILRRLVAAGERWLMRRFDMVSTISDKMLALVGRKGVAPGKALLFPNWVDISAISPLRSASPFRAELGLAPDAVVVLYSGNMGRKQGLELLPQVAALLVDRPDIQFVFCGNGAGKADLVQSCEGLPNVRLLDLQPIGRLNDLLGLADIHLLPQRAGAADLVMPSKLTGMLASGRAILATASPETQLAYALDGRGLVVPSESPEMMAEGLRRLADDASLRERLGKAARFYAEQHLDKEQVLTRLMEKLQLVCDGVN